MTIPPYIVKKLRQIAIAITFCFSLMPLITFGKNIFIQNEEGV